jgi:hypothetical protein
VRRHLGMGDPDSSAVAFRIGTSALLTLLGFLEPCFLERPLKTQENSRPVTPEVAGSSPVSLASLFNDLGSIPKRAGRRSSRKREA